MSDFNNVPQPDTSMTDWYNSFTNPTDSANSQQSNTTNPSALSDLLMYSIKLKAYAEFVAQVASSVENDIRGDIYADIAPASPINPQVPATTAAVSVNPLAFALANRENLVNVATNIVELSKAVDSILARVKTKANV